MGTTDTPTWRPPVIDLGADEEEEAPASHRCVACGTYSPRGHGAHTLISSAFGWRLARKSDPEGRITLSWRCPACWKRHREAEARQRGA